MLTGKPRLWRGAARGGRLDALLPIVWPLIALTLAACVSGNSRVTYLPPPDPPPIPSRKPAPPSQALNTAASPSVVVVQVPRQAVRPAPREAPAPVAKPDRAIPFAYVVQPGDTVYGISRKLGVPLRDVIDGNALAPPYTLSVAQSLRIPNPRRHQVRPKETVYGISRHYGVEMTELVRLNRIAPPYTISLGARLVLPAAPGAPPVRVAVTKKAGAIAVPSGKLSPPAKTEPRAVQKAAVPAAKPARLAKIPQPPPRAGGKFLWPAQGKLLASFGPKKGGLHNDGINIAAPRGAPVRAAENGVVVYSGNELRGFGNLILIKHAEGWVTAYAHTQDIKVGRGQRVKRGQTIAAVGSTGNVARPQLHFEIRKGSRAVDPKRFLGKSRA